MECLNNAPNTFTRIVANGEDIDGCIFGITSTSGTDEIEISNAEFTDCGHEASRGGSGGIIYVSLSDADAKISASNLKFATTELFYDAKALNDAVTAGEYVHISVPAEYTNLPSLVGFLSTDYPSLHASKYVY